MPWEGHSISLIPEKKKTKKKHNLNLSARPKLKDNLQKQNKTLYSSKMSKAWKIKPEELFQIKEN